MNFDHYENELDEVLIQKNPIIVWNELLRGKLNISTTDLLKLSILIERNWQKYQEHGINLSVVIVEDKKLNTGTKIVEYDYSCDIKELLGSNNKGIEYQICTNGFIIGKKFTSQKINFHNVCHISLLQKKISFILGLNGLDIIVNGVPFETKNHLDSYQDLVKWSKLVGIDSYKQLLKEFFNKHVQYDKYKRYFLYKDISPKQWHDHINKNSKLLTIKPEKIFQMELERFLKENCVDMVLNEVRNDYEERYDIWVGTNQNEIYVFEIKWLGKSITPSGNINSQYNNSDRAIAGGYQLKDYLENPSQVIKGLPNSRIHQAVLILYDAREDMVDIVYPDELHKITNLDLSQHFKMEKVKISASNSYKHLKK
ncbi:hypothetical protein CN360_11575 [Bacillus cereus]|uniref:hypothetical protein n=1 Tax=Bacillus cereus TaxID=1396 RepID=UPI000BED16F5|nr:hypothetical protein [Bacillus cereus]PEC03200.1 hypothetical protein COM98_20195 [Bacillus cereus]PEV76421.1 hypothetical protein CN437_21915 [Bacillus cereus]PEY93538.1 hypothetical protein CN360_11575 [Bacillus cereus]PGE42720.1 hypothetical protein COM63_27035 [Bacillus cereus]